MTIYGKLIIASSFGVVGGLLFWIFLLYLFPIQPPQVGLYQNPVLYLSRFDVIGDHAYLEVICVRGQTNVTDIYLNETRCPYRVISGNLGNGLQQDEIIILDLSPAVPVERSNAYYVKVETETQVFRRVFHYD